MKKALLLLVSGMVISAFSGGCDTAAVDTDAPLQASVTPDTVALDNTPDASELPTDSSSLEVEAYVHLLVGPPDVIPGRSTQITFLDSYGWDTFEATASLGTLSCGDQSGQQTVQGKKDESMNWSIDEFSDDNGFIQIKFFDSEGDHVLSRTVLITGQDELYYRVEY